MTRTERRTANRELAAWLRSHGIVPNGPAWDAAQVGERDVTTLAVTAGIASPWSAPVVKASPVKALPGTTRMARTLKVGDYLPEHGASVTGGPMSDPETGEVWVTLDNGADVAFSADGMARVVRRRQAPEWVRKCASEYRDARIAWERDRENVALGYATEMREYGESVRAPRYADFVRQAAAAMRQPESV